MMLVYSISRCLQWITSKITMRVNYMQTVFEIKDTHLNKHCFISTTMREGLQTIQPLLVAILSINSK